MLPNENPTTDLLECEALPEIASAIRERADRIISRWEEGVKKLLPGADELTLTQVRDHIPAILEQLAAALASDRPAETHELREASRVHGELRFHQHYNVRELIIEYRLLRRVVIEESHDACKDGLSVVEMVALDMGVDTAFQQGLLEFINHQKKQIESATAVESKYLRFLSHDLRNNLNHVVLVLEVMSAKLNAVPEYAEDVSEMLSAQRTVLDTMAGMETLLQAERLRKGAIQPKAEMVDLRTLVLDVVRHAHASATEKGLRVHIEVPTDAELVSDREVIALVLQNLLGNAIKYSSKGVIRFYAAPWADDQMEGWEISVGDEGPGIAPEHLGKLFQSFARGETHGQPGVGLGLTIASEAAKLLGGKLSVESLVGVGSRFRLKLPGKAKI